MVYLYFLPLALSVPLYFLYQAFLQLQTLKRSMQSLSLKLKADSSHYFKATEYSPRKHRGSRSNSVSRSSSPINISNDRNQEFNPINQAIST